MVPDIALITKERSCPICGSPLLPLYDSDTTTWGVRTIDLLCENCLHVEQLVTVVATEEERCSTTQRRTLT